MDSMVPYLNNHLKQLGICAIVAVITEVWCYMRRTTRAGVGRRVVGRVIKRQGGSAFVSVIRVSRWSWVVVALSNGVGRDCTVQIAGITSALYMACIGRAAARKARKARNKRGKSSSTLKPASSSMSVNKKASSSLAKKPSRRKDSDSD